MISLFCTFVYKSFIILFLYHISSILNNYFSFWSFLVYFVCIFRFLVVQKYFVSVIVNRLQSAKLAIPEKVFFTFYVVYIPNVI